MRRNATARKYSGRSVYEDRQAHFWGNVRGTICRLHIETADKKTARETEWRGPVGMVGVEGTYSADPWMHAKRRRGRKALGLFWIWGPG